jgi:UDP-N-acetylglucosamine--N-acetylmuramyl-(pentapeptide) pyrophosphoryl-undecaprenol N-acetylglucosamine transferase
VTNDQRPTSNDQLRFVIAGGGTGGHLYPGIAVAREVMRRRPDARVSFAGTARGIEARVLPREGFELDVIRSGGLKGKSIVDRARGAWLIPLGLADAWRLLSARRPHLVIGVGGYSSGPVVLAAALRRIPTMLLEQNAVPGLTNRLLSSVVRAAAVTFEASRPFFGDRAFVSGNPVRPEFFQAPDQAPPAATAGASGPRVLVFGGSQGAHAINVAMSEAAATLAAASPRPHVVHQTGERDVESVRTAYRQAGLPAHVEPFLFDMGRRLRAADLVVCRAGATTLAELTAAGKPSILIPLPTATDDHQRKNAEALAAEGAADVLLQSEATGERLAARILALASDGLRRERMSRAARALAKPDAARVIVDRALALAG